MWGLAGNITLNFEFQNSNKLSLAGLYPRVRAGAVMGADACGRVVGVRTPKHALQRWVGQRVVINPCCHWGADPRGACVRQEIFNSIDNSYTSADMRLEISSVRYLNHSGPTSKFTMLGMLPEPGTFAEFISVPIDRLEKAPEHLTDEQVACLPTAGLTAWRAVVTQGK